MKKTPIIFLMILMFAALACGSAAPPPMPEPVSSPQGASTPQTTSVPERTLSPAVSLETEQSISTDTTISVAGLRVIYIREGNLWSWTEVGGSAQLTDTGDMSTIRVSNDGQSLAFMRGSEVWIVRMDGVDARLVDSQVGSDGRLWFAPNNALLAVSTSEHIDVLYLNTNGKTTVVTYPVIPDGYAPEVVWMSDSSGFKTVIPMASDQAEMLYVFPDGTVASLAKFTMVFSLDFPYYFSPDGGYVIYTAKMNDGRESLYLMDSSGATRPYGEPAESIRAYGWFPDSKRFVYGENGVLRNFLGDVGSTPMEIALTLPENVRWVDASHYLAIRNGELIWGDLKGATVTIDAGVTEFDFLPVN